MGIVFIGMFVLAALALMVRSLRLNGSTKSVTFILSLVLLFIQIIQLKSFAIPDAFHFGFAGYLFLSLCLFTAVKLNFYRLRKVTTLRLRRIS
jgi:hypothetical protein